MTTAEKLGILVAVLAIAIPLAWTIWTHYEQGRVKLRAEVSIKVSGRGVLLVARLVNDGRGPVFIERVAVERARPMEGTGGALASLPMSPSPAPPAGPMAPIEPGNYRDYILARHLELSAMGDIRNSRLYDYWISVRTPKGEAMKIRDRLFLDTLKSFADDTPPRPGATFG